MAEVKKTFISDTLREQCKKRIEDFSRKRALRFTTIVSLIMNLIKKTLQIEISSFLHVVQLADVSKQAFSQGRKKVSPEVFELLNQKLIKEFYSDNIIEVFKGLRVLAIDSSKIRLPNTIELQEVYGTAKVNNNASGRTIPQGRVSLLFDVFNNLTIHSSLSSFRTSERNLAMEHIENLSKLDNEIKNNNATGDLILFDRGYPSLFLMFFLHSKNKHFLMRCPSSFIAEIDTFVKTGAKDALLVLPAFNKWKESKRHFTAHLPNLSSDAQITVRILVYELSSGEQEIIATTLLDQELYTYDDIFWLYSKRWSIEEGYKFYKCIAELENFSGISKIAIEQDFFATVFTCNVTSLLAMEAQEEINREAVKKNNKFQYKINRNIAIGTIKNEILKVFLEDHDLNVFCEQLKARMKRGLVSVRPGRSFPRAFRMPSKTKPVRKRSL